MLATRLFGFYRASEANDPEIFIAGATAMLAQYPQAVVEKVCDPVRGLPATSKWLPSIAEIREAAEREMVWWSAVERRDRERAHTAKVVAAPPPPTAEQTRRIREMADTLIAKLSAGDKEKPLGFRPPRSPSEAEVSRRYHEGRLEALKALYASAPLTESARLRAKYASAEEVADAFSV